MNPNLPQFFLSIHQIPFWVPLMLLMIMTVTSCRQKPEPAMRIQGHRGCRGLYPENTLEAFEHALKLGVDVLELDVVISRDNNVVISHEPWLNEDICLDYCGNPIKPNNGPIFNIYEMGYPTIYKCDCGSLGNPRFPEQKKIQTQKPRLKVMLGFCEKKAIELGRPLPEYNIEIKSDPKHDTIFHPLPKPFLDRVMEIVAYKVPVKRVVIQSFDIRILELMHSDYPQYRTALLVEDDESPYEKLKLLSHTPRIVSPWYGHVDEDLVLFCEEKGMALVPWTVNEEDAMQELALLGVKELITDYPDRAMKLFGRENETYGLGEESASADQ